jgi:hypothetical protein
MLLRMENTTLSSATGLYVAPAIGRVGSVSELTQGGSGGGVDSQGGVGSCYSGATATD